jgi:hypothetical protein
MMKKIYICSIVLTLLAFLSCSEEKLGEFSGEIVYISFIEDASKDSTVFSFQTYPSGEIVADVPVRIRGHWLTSPRAFTVSVDPDSTSLPASSYELPEKCEFAPGQELDTIQIKFLNNFDDLKNKAYRLFLRINESENVKQGEKAYRIAKFYVSDKLEIPVWWSRNDGTEWNPYNIVEERYLGKYSELKYKLFLDRLAEDDASFDGTDMNVLKKYALRLKYWLEENPTYDEDNNEWMQVPVAG